MLGGSFAIRVSQLIVNGLITALRAVERFFAEFFDFLFDNTLACYLVFALFFPTILPFILLLCFNDYWLE